MEADKVTVFLFLLLVGIMAFSGFMIYDALNEMPALGRTSAGVNMVTQVNNPTVPLGGVGMVVAVNNPNFDGGLR